MPLNSSPAPAATRRPTRSTRPAAPAHWLRSCLETHISLPLFALFLLAAIWSLTAHVIASEREAANAAALESVREMADIYEAQVARNLAGIDQTLKMIQLAVQTKGDGDALQSLAAHGLLPSGLVFVVSIADKDGNIVASNPAPMLPDAARPDAARPDVARPDAARPFAARPDVARPDLARLFAARPDDARPDVARPDAARPFVARPDVARPFVARPFMARSNIAGQAYFAYHRSHRDLNATWRSMIDGSGALADSPYVGKVERDHADAPWHVHFSRRIDDARGAFQGVAIIEAHPAYFTSGYERSRQGERGMVGVFGTDGVFRAMREGDTVSWGQQAGPQASELERPLGALASAWDGKLRYSAVRALHGFPLYAMVALDRDEQFAAFERHRRNWLWASFGASVLLIAIVALVCGWSWQLTRTQRRIRRAQETFAAAAEASLDAFFVMRSVFDDDGAISDFIIEASNDRAERITGLRRHVLEGGRLLTLMPSYRDNGIFDDMVKAALQGGMREAEWRGGTDRTRDTWMHRQVVAVEGGVVAIVRDITERKRAEERIAHMAHHDALTGLPNRSLIADRLDQAILQAQRKRRCVALAFIDLDGFKLVNDGLGHGAGDDLLKVVGMRMQDCLRADDTLGRFGGDEFVIILSDLSDNALAVTPVLEKIRLAVREPVQIEGQQVQVSCSMGVVMYPRDGVDPAALMVNADAAMYRAKELGHNNFQFYTREMNERVEEKLQLLEGLRQALAGDQLRLLYQPKVDLRSGRIFGVEALIRWHHPQHGVISPLRFIGLAEESGLIVAIGEWVLRTACCQNMAWRAAGLPPVTVSVNVSPRQFEERRLVERVALALADSGLAAADLELEVTESLIMRDLAQSVGKMGELKDMGVALSIDDFGTGYSSLSALKSFPISSLKIDKSFVSELADNADDQAIAMAVISLGHKLDLRVIAEGVETAQQMRFLRENDCDEMQGYLFSPPVAAEQIAELLRAQAGNAVPSLAWELADAI